MAKSNPVSTKIALCPTCKRDLLPGLKDEKENIFATFQLGQQFDKYFRGKKLSTLLEHYRPIYRRMMKNVLSAMEIFEAGDLTMLMFLEATNATWKAQNQLLVVLGYVKEVPLGAQLRYPFHVAVYCGKGKPSNASLLLSEAIPDLRRMSAQFMVWRDHLDRERRSRVFLTTFLTDGKEKPKVTGIQGGGYYSCPICKEERVIITDAEYPEVFEKSKVHVHH
jgi:hypothetical protein